ncbi:MAG: AAA family ATPase [Patescibacteria group bacterium]|jgi:chromosome segregation protein
MYLEKFELRGFKSFADPVTLTFTPGITAIVGPNGSGKSNVSDAIRWVLGEQSMKLLRGKRSEDVIFSGSDRKSQLGMAEVSMTINNSDGKMPVDHSEVTITRRVYRSGEGEYLLNKKTAKLQDMLMLFAKAHFGQKSYSVVGQGMIDAILVATPTERKNFFDEAAGVRQYQMKREQTIRRLDETRENLGKAEMLMGEIEPHLRSLTRQVRRLERRGEVEGELHDIQSAYYARRYWLIKQEESTFTQKCDAHEQELGGVKQRVDETQKALEQLEKEQGREERFQRLQQEYSAMLEQKNRLLRESAELKGRLDADAISKGDLPVVWLKKRKEELENDLTRYEEQQEQLRGKATKLAQEQKSTDRELNGVRDAFSKATSAFDAMRNILEQLDAPEMIVKEAERLAGDHAAFVQEAEKTESLEKLKSLLKDASVVQKKLTAFAEKLVRYTASDPRTFLDLHESIQKTLTRRAELEQRSVMQEQEQAGIERESSMQEQFMSGIREELERVRKELKRADTSDKKEAGDATSEELSEIEEKITELNTRLTVLRTTIAEFNTQEEGKREELFRLQKGFRDEQQELNNITQKLNAVRVELAKIQAHREDLERELRGELPEARTTEVFEAKEPKEVDIAASEREIERLKHQLELIGGIDEGVQEEYSETNERFEKLSVQTEDLIKAIADLEKAIAELDITIKREFMRSFEKINKEFGKYFKGLFEGGRAELVLIKEEPREESDDADEDDDEDDDASEDDVLPEKKPSGEKVVTGVDIRAVPPGKRVSTINMLSGGERALTSIALLSAIIATNPSPFVFLDEVDAALDEANSQRFARILKDLASKTQFIAVTHNRATMEQADILYGVTMGNDSVSKILSVKMEEVDKVIASQGNRR